MRKLTAAEFIVKARNTHGDRFDYSLVDYKNYWKHIIIICKIHGEFYQTPRLHLSGNGCSKCYDERRPFVKRSNSEDFINKANIIHNKKYDYFKFVYITNRNKGIIICPNHGEFTQTANSHLSGRGCNKCADNVQLTTEEFIDRARKVHRDLYDYSKVNYIRNRSEIEIGCKIHGIFLQIPANHLNLKEGCPYCANNVKLTTDIFIQKATLLHNNEYDYSQVKYGKNNMEKVSILCKKHGEFKQRPLNHLVGNKCPKCDTSKGETKIRDFLIKNNIEHVHQKSFENCVNPNDKNRRGKLKFDFYILSKNILIEYDGKQHYLVGSNIRGKHIVTDEELKEIKYRDSIKTQYAIDNGIRLLRIKYTEINKIDDILILELK